MAAGEAAEVKLPACCISHEFYKAASKSPDQIAVIHASGFARIARDCAANRQLDGDDGTKSAFAEMASSSRPSVYGGDECFTFSDILSAVENLSSRLRHILNGGDDLCLVNPRSANTISGKTAHASESVQYSSRSLQCTRFRNNHTPKVIGIYMEPSVEYIVAVLSVLRCGEAFMPLDPTWPKARISSLVSSSNADLVIGIKTSNKGDCCHRLDSSQWLIDEGSCPVLSVSMDNIKEQSYPMLLGWPCESESLRSFCYLMYTSGSTGKPKGVCGTEIGLLNRFIWMQETYPLDEGDVVLFKTAISFIDHLQEFLGAVLSTCTLVIPPFNQLKENIFYVVDYIQGYFINRLVAVPSLMRAILPSLQSPHFATIQDSLKLLVLSGEVLHLSLCNELLRLLPQTSILNLYGSTEVTGDCTYFDCKRLPLILEKEVLSSIPVGLPVLNCDVVLVGKDAPFQGEIYVGGLCVAAGYFQYPYIMPLADGDLFTEHDIRCPLTGSRVQHYFKTGDFARKLPSGDLIFLGRKDRTVNINGQRIALEEIESVLRGHPDVVDAAVLPCEVDGEFLLLEAHVVTERTAKDEELLKSSLRNWVLSKLPQMMLPNQIVFTGSLPLTSSGKVDYVSLTASTPSDQQARINIEEIPQDYLIQVIRKVFSDALMVEKISGNDNFFAMGGNSVTAAYVSFKLGIHMKLLYTFPTPLRLQMALLSSSSSLGTDAHLGEKLRRGVLLEKKPRFSILHESKPHGMLFLSDSDSDAQSPAKKLKTQSNTDAVPFEEQNSRDSLSNPNLVHKECSFSRCNKNTHKTQCEESYSCERVGSNIIQRDRKVFMQEQWKVDMNSCVDASPLVVFKGSDIFLFIGAHSHKFVSINGKSGIVQWETKLEGRVECSAAILDDFSQVVVGCYQGIIYFLHFSNGNICWSFRTDGEVKSQPVVDRCRHLVWCGSYDHNLYAIDYKNYCCIYKLPCGGSIFGSPAISEMQQKLYVASTGGHVTALEIKSLPYKKLWKRDMGAPVFGSLSMNYSEENIICCLVDGTVVVLGTCGSVVWKVSTGGPIFAGPCTSQAFPSQVLICSRDGSIYSYEVENGDLIWKHALGHPITSSPYVDEDSQLISNTSNLSERLICVCDSSGSIYVLRVLSNSIGDLKQNREHSVKEFARLDLQGDVFSSPVMIGGHIYVGCRDNHVYCIKLDVE